MENTARKITRDAHLEYLSDFRKFIEKNCDLVHVDDELKYDLVLAVDEACTNIIMHGYEGVTTGQITVMFGTNKEQLRITISDSGRPFDPDHAPLPDFLSPAQDRPIGGLGVYLLKLIADEVLYETNQDDMNYLTLIKNYSSSGGNQQQS